MADYYAEVTCQTGTLTDDQQIEIAETLAAPTAHDTLTGLTRASMVLDAPTLRQATDAALRAVRGATTAPVVELRVLTLAAFEAELARPEPLDLVGSTEGGQLLEVSRQRFEELARTHADFPQHVAELARGKVWTRDSVVAFNERWDRKRTGRPRKVLNV